MLLVMTIIRRENCLFVLTHPMECCRVINNVVVRNLLETIKLADSRWWVNRDKNDLVVVIVVHDVLQLPMCSRAVNRGEGSAPNACFTADSKQAMPNKASEMEAAAVTASCVTGTQRQYPAMHIEIWRMAIVSGHRSWSLSRTVYGKIMWATIVGWLMRSSKMHIYRVVVCISQVPMHMFFALFSVPLRTCALLCWPPRGFTQSFGPLHPPIFHIETAIAHFMHCTHPNEWQLTNYQWRAAHRSLALRPSCSCSVVAALPHMAKYAYRAQRYPIYKSYFLYAETD